MFTHILILVPICWSAASAQICSLLCGPGQQCALVREGRGPPFPDCISSNEAVLLEQALQGGPTGPGAGVVNAVSRLGWQMGLSGGGLLGSNIGFLNSGVGAPFGVWVDPLFGVDPSFGAGGVEPSFGMGVNSAVGHNSRPNVGVTNPRRNGPAALNDRSRGAASNNPGNNSGGGHNHGGANDPPQGTPGLRPNCFPCRSNSDCASQRCVFSPACEQNSCLFL